MRVPATRPDLPARWPVAVRAEVDRRHAALAPGGGRVLDLCDPAQRHVLEVALEEGVTSSARGRYDVICSPAALVRFADLAAAVEALAAMLAPQGEILAIEPIGRPGPGGLLAGSAGALLPAARGTHLGRDVPATIRSAGLTITDIERFSMPTPVWPLRPFVQLRALRPEGVLA